jgi:hypothetical protein
MKSHRGAWGCSNKDAYVRSSSQSKKEKRSAEQLQFSFHRYVRIDGETITLAMGKRQILKMLAIELALSIMRLTPPPYVFSLDDDGDEEEGLENASRSIESATEPGAAPNARQRD